MATEGDIELEQEQDGEKETETEENKINDTEENKINDIAISMAPTMSREEKRKLLKKMKRKQFRRETAIKEREIAETMANDPEITARLRRLEEEEAERMERDRREFEERERRFIEALELKKRQQEQEEEARKKRDEEAKRDLVNDGDEHEGNEGEDWEYVEEGPAEIIWKGNEIIVKKKKVKVPKKVLNLEKEKQESEGPISNPLAPQSEAFEDYKSAQEVLDSVAQQVPNFGTEQDKAHCPFHLKTGVCRFGTRCSRVHFYPDKSCTILIKNMYSGPGLAWEQDEGLEHTDEEVERSFEEFYEDVHTEFLKFGEIVNFKVCKNASSHLRGNVYVHYKLLEAAMLAYQSMNGRYFAGKQLSCEFVNLTRWKVAICGEYIKSRLKTCSRGSACNFIHCFRNPGGDYEWADWEKPAPRYWLKEMAVLFGYSNDRFTDENLRYHRKRSRSRGPDSPHRKSPSDEDGLSRSKYLQRHRGDREEKISTTEDEHVKRRKTDNRELESSLRKKKEAYSSYVDSNGNSLLREKHTHDNRKRSKVKDEADLSDSSNGSRSGRGGSSRKKRSISKSKNRSDYGEYKRKSDSLERDEDRCHSHSRKSSRSMNVIDGSRIGRDENKHRRNRKQSQGSDKQSDFTDSESEIHRYRTDGKRRRSTKCPRKGKHNAESSDNTSEGSRSLKSEKRPKKGRTRSRSKNNFDFLDDESNVRGRNREERHDETVRTKDIVPKQKEKADVGPGNSSFDADVDSNLSEKGKIVDGPYIRNFEFRDPSLSRRSAESRDSCYEGLVSTRDPQSDELEHRSPVNKNNETTSSNTAEACEAGNAEAELEQSYRIAALKKLEEMRKSKNADHENIVEVAKDTRETGGADSRRRRI